MIRVLIVEDSLVMAKLIAAILNSDSQIMVAGTAKDGEEAVRLAPKLRPDIITMDIHMPKMDGLEATKQIMAYSPIPILIFSSSVLVVEKGVDKVFKAMSYGALDVMEKNLFEGDKVDEKLKNELIKKIKFLSTVRVIPHPLAKIERRTRKLSPLLRGIKKETGEKIVGIVASTGGPQALAAILKALPKDFPTPIVMVQHISPGFAEGLVNWLNTESSLKVKMAENDEPLKPGTAYLAPTNLQMSVTLSKRVSLSSEPAVGGYCPSGTVLLQSIAETYGNTGIGVLLTGMGCDGVDGLKEIHDAKGYAIAQDEASSIIFGMPKAAINLGAADKVVSLDDMADQIMKWVAE